MVLGHRCHPLWGNGRRSLDWDRDLGGIHCRNKQNTIKMNFTLKRGLKHMWQQQVSLYESAKLGCLNIDLHAMELIKWGLVQDGEGFHILI